MINIFDSLKIGTKFKFTIEVTTENDWSKHNIFEVVRKTDELFIGESRLKVGTELKVKNCTITKTSPFLKYIEIIEDSEK